MSGSIVYKRPILWDLLNEGAPYTPLPWQAEHIHSKVDAGYRFIVAACGRRAGKTEAMKAEVVRQVMRPPETVAGKTHYPIVYIAGPNHELADRIFDPVRDLFVPDQREEFTPALYELYKSHDKQRGIVELVNGAVIKRRTFDDPKSMQGERVTAAFVEESQDCSEDGWKMLLPSLIDGHGILYSIGVPWGRGRFRTLFELGKGGEKGYYAFSVPTQANPNLTEEMIQSLASSMTELEYRAHILAEWVDEYGAVFREPNKPFEQPRRPHHGPYFMGLDIGQMQDFTVAYVIDVPTMQIVDRDRMQAIDYVSQMERIASLYRKWKVRSIHMDITGAGRGPGDMLRSLGCSVSEFNFTANSKQELVSTLVRAVEQGMVSAMPDDDVLRTEMRLFEGKIVSTASGTRVDYGHPSGAHDDCVMALALAVHKAIPYHKSIGKSPSMGSYVDLKKSKHIKNPLQRLILEANKKRILEGIS